MRYLLSSLCCRLLIYWWLCPDLTVRFWKKIIVFIFLYILSRWSCPFFFMVGLHGLQNEHSAKCGENISIVKSRERNVAENWIWSSGWFLYSLFPLWIGAMFLLVLYGKALKVITTFDGTIHLYNPGLKFSWRMIKL